MLPKTVSYMGCGVTVIALAFYQSCFLFSPNLFHCLLYIFENNFMFPISVTLLSLSQIIFLWLEYSVQAYSW